MCIVRALPVLLLAVLDPAQLHAHEQAPALPDATIDLRTRDGADALRARWRYADARIVDADFHAPGPDLRPTGPAVPTHDLSPRADSPDFDAADWTTLDPSTLEARRSSGRLALAWYRLDLTIPDRAGTLDTRGAAAVLELTVDDYAEVWVNGRLPQVLGSSGSALIAGWNTPNRVLLGRHLHPGDTFHVAILAANAPLSAPPANYVWIRSATLDFYREGSPGSWVNAPVPVPTTITRLDPRLDAVVSPGAVAERLADGFAFTEGPVWVPRLHAGKSYGGGGQGGYLLFSDPNKNVIHRWDPDTGAVSIFRTKSGYTGVGGPDIGLYHQPGSNGLTLSPEPTPRLTICEHGNRRVTRLEPNGSLTILADRFQGQRLNSPNDLVYRSDGILYFTDPPFGLPKVFDDPRKETPFSGVYAVVGGEVRLLSRDLAGPNGLAFSPDEKHLYVDNWDEARKVVLRFDVAPDGSLANPTTFVNLTGFGGELAFDGLKVDAAGNVYLSAPDGVRVYAPDATHLGTISLPELPANFTFGDDDARTLYMTARTGLYRLRLNIPSGVKR